MKCTPGLQAYTFSSSRQLSLISLLLITPTVSQHFLSVILCFYASVPSSVISRLLNNYCVIPDPKMHYWASKSLPIAIPLCTMLFMCNRRCHSRITFSLAEKLNSLVSACRDDKCRFPVETERFS